MTEQDKRIAELCSFAMDATVVIDWLIDTVAPPLPDHIRRHLRGMSAACDALPFAGADSEEQSRERLTKERDRLRDWLAAIESVTDDEIGARFRTSSSKSEEQSAGQSRIYTMLQVPRDLARAALRGDQYIKSVDEQKVRTDEHKPEG